MRVSELKHAPQWLLDAKVENEDVDMVGGRVIWRAGVWYGGEWHGGMWCCGVWHGGEWHGGAWHVGAWHGGVWHVGAWHGGVWHGGEWHGGAWYVGAWHGGVWHDGAWCGGEWLRGDWRDGEWRGGVWRGGEWYSGEWLGGTWFGGEWHDQRTPNRTLYMASLIGIVPDSSGICVAYRTTKGDGRGRYSCEFTQPEGEYYEDDADEAGAGTCLRGIHVTTAARAWTYFGIDPSCQMWEVKFHINDLLDCDGDKARIRGGTFRKIALPWAGETVRIKEGE